MNNYFGINVDFITKIIIIRRNFTMKRTTILLTLLIALAISFWSCQSNQMPVESEFKSNSTVLQKSLVKAVLQIELLESVPTNNPFYLMTYNVSKDWIETEVTWNKATSSVPWTPPGGEYDSPDPMGFKEISNVHANTLLEVDVTELWVNGVPPYGIILKAKEPILSTGVITFSSREGSTAPKVVVTFKDENMQEYDVEYPVVEDAYINANEPDMNMQTSTEKAKKLLYIGKIGESEKRSLLKFVPDEENNTCETAFGWNEDYANCFIKGVDDNSFNNWGWTNGKLSPDLGSYEFELWAGAGQCDRSKGTLVGNVIVDYVGSTATVAYVLKPGFTMDEAHLYVGTKPFPEVKRGKKMVPTVAPGQYPYKVDLNGATTCTFEVDGLLGDIYVIAHAVVCGNYKLTDN